MLIMAARVAALGDVDLLASSRVAPCLHAHRRHGTQGNRRAPAPPRIVRDSRDPARSSPVQAGCADLELARPAAVRRALEGREPRGVEVRVRAHEGGDAQDPAQAQRTA